MTWRVRPMVDADIEDVYAIETSVHIAPWNKSILRDCVLVGYNCLVLEINVDNQWVLGGYIICRHKDEYYHILNFCIAKLMQSQGYGRKFLQKVLNVLALNKEIKYIILEVRPSNKGALYLYKTLGFELAEIKKEYYKDNNKTEDAILLKKILRP
jgi:[ribosomal protein S18]-alanine N-acetyltransferase